MAFSGKHTGLCSSTILALKHSACVWRFLGSIQATVAARQSRWRFSRSIQAHCSSSKSTLVATQNSLAFCCLHSYLTVVYLLDNGWMHGWLLYWVPNGYSVSTMPDSQQTGFVLSIEWSRNVKTKRWLWTPCSFLSHPSAIISSDRWGPVLLEYCQIWTW